MRAGGPKVRSALRSLLTRSRDFTTRFRWSLAVTAPVAAAVSATTETEIERIK